MFYKKSLIIWFIGAILEKYSKLLPQIIYHISQILSNMILNMDDNFGHVTGPPEKNVFIFFPLVGQKSSPNEFDFVSFSF